MTPPRSTERRTQTGFGPLKETAWGARPRTVSPAALLGDRLNSRRPAPIYMRGGGPTARGWNREVPLPWGIFHY